MDINQLMNSLKETYGFSKTEWNELNGEPLAEFSLWLTEAVSYTHLDVYKRQIYPASVREVASAIANGTSKSFASVFTR